MDFTECLRLSYLWAGGHMQLSATGSKNSKKKKISENL